MKNSFVIISIFTLMLTGCASGPKSKVISNNVDSLKGKKNVYIGQYAVTFITEDKGSAKSNSPMFRGDSTSAQANVVAKLSGVPDEVFKSIATKAYNDFVTDLTANGFIVKSSPTLDASKKWKDLDPLKDPYKTSALGSVGGFLKGEKRKFATYSADPLKLYAAPETPGSTVVIPSEIGEVAQSLDTPIFMINHVVHFAYFGSKTEYVKNYATDFKTSTATAEVSLGQGIQVTSGSTAQFVIDGGGTFSKSGAITIADPIVVGGAYGKNENSTSGATKAANIFSSALGMFSGKSSSSEEISIIANPQYFEAGALQALDEANNRIVKELSL